MTAAAIDLESAASALAQSADYRVLRRLPRISRYHDEPWNLGDRAQIKIALFVDVETTGLDKFVDEIVEFAAVPFTYDAVSGTVYEVLPGYAGFEEPKAPMQSAAQAVHGITVEMLKGQSLDSSAITRLLNSASLIIAHNAGFDRPIVERRFPEFARAPWACSYADVEWEAFGAVGKKLEHVLLYTCQTFYDAHRAEDDCRAGIHALATASLGGRPAMHYLLDAARTPTTRVWASGAPFDLKDTLKVRGYRWSAESRTWFRDVRGDAEEERAWLAEHDVNADCRSMNAKDRYSVRADV